VIAFVYLLTYLLITN